jgi:hypothetical protein
VTFECSSTGTVVSSLIAESGTSSIIDMPRPIVLRKSCHWYADKTVLCNSFTFDFIIMLTPILQLHTNEDPISHQSDVQL